jgi:hypothetical protein
VGEQLLQLIDHQHHFALMLLGELAQQESELLGARA